MVECVSIEARFNIVAAPGICDHSSSFEFRVRGPTAIDGYGIHLIGEEILRRSNLGFIKESTTYNSL